MRFTVDGSTLSVSLELEDEPVDLTVGGLGAAILDTATREMERAALNEHGPDGTAWRKLRPSTAGRKGFDRVGVESGQMLRDLAAGELQITPTVARWSYPRGDTWGRAHGFHNGRVNTRFGQGWIQEPRPLVGWTPAAEVAARLLVAVAVVHQGLQPVGDFAETPELANVA